MPGVRCLKKYPLLKGLEQLAVSWTFSNKSQKTTAEPTTRAAACLLAFSPVEVNNEVSFL